jgi:hypothetical protein
MKFSTRRREEEIQGAKVRLALFAPSFPSFAPSRETFRVSAFAGMTK